MIRNIIFDCSDTLLHFGGIDYLTEKLGSREAATRLHFTMFHTPAWFLYDNGKLPDDEVESTLLPPVPDADKPLAAHYLKEWINTYSIIDGMPELVEDVRKAGYKIYLLSDFPRCFNVLLERFPMLHQFDGRVVSYEVGYAKRDRKIFDCILEKYSLHPAECVFIDDVQRNVEISEEFGITGIRFTDAAQLRRELMERGIL